MEKPNWQFVLFGLVGLPWLGHLLATLVAHAGHSSALAAQVCYFLLPGVMALMNAGAYLVGSSERNYMVRRGGEQGLLAVLGFAIANAFLVLTGHYASFVALR